MRLSFFLHGFFLIILLFNPALAKIRPCYCYVDQGEHNVGMFSVFSYVAGVLDHYDKTPGYLGLEVNFEKRGLYYSPQHGTNWWEYYCEPIKLGTRTPYTPIKRFSRAEDYRYYAFFALQLPRERMYDIIQKYIKIRPELLEKVDNFESDNFHEYTICVHYRGTDKKMEVPRTPYYKVVQAIKKHVGESHLENYQIYVASDEQAFIDYMETTFGALVITYPALRSSDSNPLHTSHIDRHQHGAQALIECLLLSRGDFLVRTSSNLSSWSLFFNPYLPNVEL